MTLDTMTGITNGSHTAADTFCKSQLITCNRVKECNGVCPFEDALKHADKMQTMNEQHTVDHDRDWIIGCIEHDGFIHTHRFDKANQIIHDALSAEAVYDGEACAKLMDMVDRPTGEWVRKYDKHINCYWYECNQCGEDRPRNVFGKEWSSPYCPNCGARMEAKSET